MVLFATRWKLARDELARASARERDFVLRRIASAADADRDLPRAAMSSWSCDGGASPETLEEDMDVVVGELDRLARVSDQLLILATAEHVRFTAREPVDLARVVGATVNRWRATTRRDWRLHLKARGTVIGDRERLETALDALLDNAVKATGAGDRIAIELRADGQSAVIEVADSGTGIAPEDAQRVFDRFWRAEDRAGAARSGTGLGLAIVKTIAEAHGGTAEVSTNGLGGATFRIRLPGFAWIQWPMARVAVPCGPAAG